MAPKETLSRLPLMLNRSLRASGFDRAASRGCRAGAPGRQADCSALQVASVGLGHLRAYLEQAQLPTPNSQLPAHIHGLSGSLPASHPRGRSCSCREQPAAPAARPAAAPFAACTPLSGLLGSCSRAAVRGIAINAIITTPASTTAAGFQGCGNGLIFGRGEGAGAGKDGGSGGTRSICSRSGSINAARGGGNDVVDGDGGVGSGSGDAVGRIQPRLVMVFTCAKCETRSTQSFSKLSYTKGVVLVRCPGCQKLHLIADHLGWFGEEPFVLHEFLAAQGGNVVQVTTAEPKTHGSESESDSAAAKAFTAAVGAHSPVPGLAARTAAAAAAVEASPGGMFELGSELQVRTALAAARELQGRQHAQQPPDR